MNDKSYIKFEPMLKNYKENITTLDINIYIIFGLCLKMLQK
jgi:hypothetical protein